MASAPEVIARFIQTPREQENRLLRALRHCYFLVGQWYIQLLGWVQMLTVRPVINEREMIAISEISYQGPKGVVMQLWEKKKKLCGRK